MSEFVNIFMPGARHWDEVRRAEKMLVVDTLQSGSGPAQLDLDSGHMVLRDLTGNATEALTDRGNPSQHRPTRPTQDRRTTAADDISQTPPAADQTD